MARVKRGASPVDSAADTPVVHGEGEGGSLTIFDNIADDTYIMIWRRDGTSKRMVYMGRLSPAEATEEKIMEACGGGYYQCREKVTDADGAQHWGRSRSFEIGGPWKPNGSLASIGQMPQSPANAPAAVAGAPATAPGGFVNTADIMNAGLLQLFQANKEVSAMQMAAVQAMSNRPQMDVGAIIAALAPVVIAMVERRPEQPEKVDVLAIVEKVTEMVKVNTSPANSFKEQLAMMNEVLDLKDRAAPATGEEDTSLMGVVSQHLGKLLDIIQQGQKKPMPKRVVATVPVPPAGAGPATGAGSTPASLPNATMTPTADTDPNGLPAWTQVVTPWRKNLLGLAMRGKDADTTARFLFMVAPDTSKGIIREFMISSPDPVADLLAFMPELAPYENWVAEFCQEIADGLGLLDDGEPGEPVEEVPPTQDTIADIMKPLGAQEVTRPLR